MSDNTDHNLPTPTQPGTTAELKEPSEDDAITAATRRQGEALLGCLVLLTQHFKRPYSAEGLTAGQPLVDGYLTPALFIRAAERAGFNASLVKRDLRGISDDVLPIVLLMEDDALILSRQENAVCTIINAKGESTKVSLSDVEGGYKGLSLYLKPAYDFFDDDGAEGQSQGHWFWSVIKRSRGIYSEVIIASLLINLFALATPLFIMNVYDRVVPNYAVETLWVLASGVFIVFLFDLVMKSLRGYFIDIAGKRADIILSSKTFSRVMDIRMSERPNRVGSFANNLQEFDSFREFFTSTTLITVIDLPFVLLFVLLIYSIGGMLAAVPLIAIPLVILTGILLQAPLQDVINKTFAESAKKHAMLVESLTALDAIKGARAEGVMQQRWEGHNGRLAKLSLRSRLLSLITVNLAQTIQQLSTVAIVILGVYLIMLGQLTVGGLIACTILTGRCLTPMAQVAGIFTRYHHSMAAYQSINRIMQLPTELPAGHKFLHRPELDGGVEFREVSFSYPGQQVPALRGVSLKIEPGEHVGILGKIGSGKTTLQKMMMKYYSPAEGSILIGGTDIMQLDPTDLRRKINYVPQDIILFDGSIRDNIVMGEPKSDDAAVLRAAQLSGLDDFVNQHPQGYDLPVGERGTNVSGGQRQSIAIARAFIGDANMLILDEPTNSMDSAAEAVFRERIRGYLEDLTLILVTHKTTMLTLVNRLIVMNEGRVVADGPKDEVLRALSRGQPGAQPSSPRTPETAG